MQRTRTHQSSSSRFSNLFSRSRRHEPATARSGDRLTAPNPHHKLVRFTRRGGVKGPLLAWILGVPIPLILLFLLIRGCVA